MRKFTAIGVLVSLAGFAPVASSQQIAAEEEQDPRYHVEMIVFANANGDRGEEDFFHGIEQLHDGPLPYLLRLPELKLESVYGYDPRRVLLDEPDGNVGSEQPEVDDSVGSTEPIGALPEIPPPFELTDRLELIDLATIGSVSSNPLLTDNTESVPEAFRPLRTDELELTEIRDRWNNLSRYRVLGHAGWVQTGVDEEQAIQLDLKRVGITNPSGTIKLWLGRFLHVGVDLEYFDGVGTFWQTTEEPFLLPLEYATPYRLRDERNAIRRGELHFIDHPLFGILVRITRAPEPEEETEAETEGGPAA